MMFKKAILIIFFLTGCLPAQGIVVDTFFYSASLAEVREVDVYLPEDYYSGGAAGYRVIYFLHGAMGDQNSYSMLISILDGLIGSQSIRPVIVVKPDGSAEPFWGSCYTNSVLYGDFENYIVNDLVEFIDSSFRTRTDRIYRCPMGHSLGGYGAAKLAFKHPDIFCGFASLSGPLDFSVWLPSVDDSVRAENIGPPYEYIWNSGEFTNFVFTGAGAFSPNLVNPPYYIDFPFDADGYLIESVTARWYLHNAPYLAASLPETCDLAIYFDCGLDDEYVMLPVNESFADSLEQIGLDFEYQVYGGNHTNRLNQRFPIALTFLDSVMNYCYYLPGDANMANGAWPPAVIGSDVTYLVNYFRGMITNPACMLDNFYGAADVNASCSVIGGDVTRLVAYFRGQGIIEYCPDYPPVWITPADCPAEAPSGWPNCEEPLLPDGRPHEVAESE